MSYINTQLERVKETNQYGRSIKITADGGAKETNFIAIDQWQFNAIEGILLHDTNAIKNVAKMEAYELFMNLQMWSLETLRGWLQYHDQNGEYLDDPENGFVFTREYAINTIFKFLILDNQ
jgi:hypothetical protein